MEKYLRMETEDVPSATKWCQEEERQTLGTMLRDITWRASPLTVQTATKHSGQEEL